MAEARSIASLEKRVVKLSYGDDGIHFTINIIIPRFSVLRRLIARRVRASFNWIGRSLYPLHPAIAALLVVIGVVWICVSDPDDWIRTGWLASVVWGISLHLPWLDSLPLKPRLAVLAAATSFSIAILVATVQRILILWLLKYKGFLYHARKPTLAVKLWFLVMRLLVRGSPNTYDFQSALPSLPVPPVRSTVMRYLDAVQPMQDKKTFAKTKGMAEDFLASVANKLQRYLILKSWYAPNYVTDWWEQYVYLHGRDPIVVNSNYYVLDGNGLPSTVQEARLALILYNMLSYSEKLANETIKPTLINGVVPLCMHQFRRLFYTTRLPGRECDRLQHWDDASRSRHVVVLCNGSFYKLHLYRANGCRLERWELQQQLAAIKADAMAHTPSQAEASIAALTAERRTRWAELREAYFAEGANRRSLHVIESAFLFVHMDMETEDCDTWEGRARSLMHGDATTRWFDKSISLVVFKNGRSGLNAEHSFADAPVVAHLFEVSMILGEKLGNHYDEDGNLKIGRSTAGCSRSGSLRPWRRLTWALSRPCEEAIATAVVNTRQLISDLDLRVVCFNQYGKGFMKKCRVSPDAYIQMAMQLAYFRDIGEFHATYEASMTRLFKQGRTETVRPVTQESVAFVKAMSSSSSSPDAKLAALQAAAARHQRRYQDAMAGKGIDRHLFALYIVSRGMEVESEFLKTALGEPWRLSTSQQPQNQTGLWDPRAPEDACRISPGGGFGPVADDGYGVSYMVASDAELYFHVSSKLSSAATDSTRFVGNLFKALEDMKAVLSLAGSSKEKKT